MESTVNMTPQEQEVRDALAAYKSALIKSNYRSWWHRTLCWAGDPSALMAEISLRAAENAAKAVVNRSPAHQDAARAVSRQQPESVRQKDSFLSLLC